jgi:hypothetical protein
MKIGIPSMQMFTYFLLLISGLTGANPDMSTPFTISQFTMDEWMNWGFTSFIFALDRLIRTARDHRQ